VVRTTVRPIVMPIALLTAGDRPVEGSEGAVCDTCPTEVDTLGVGEPVIKKDGVDAAVFDDVTDRAERVDDDVEGDEDDDVEVDEDENAEEDEIVSISESSQY